MAGNAISLQVFVSGNKMGARRSAATSAGNTRDCIGDHDAFGKGNGRSCSKRSSSWVTTRTSHQDRFAVSVALGGSVQLFTIQLRLAESGSSKKIRRGVLHLVPFFVGFLAAQTIVGRKINHRDTGVEKTRGGFHSNRVRRSEEHHIAIEQLGVVVARESQIGYAGKRRIHACEGCAFIGIGGNNTQIEFRMSQHDAHQLCSCISGCAYDTDLQHFAEPSFDLIAQRGYPREFF